MQEIADQLERTVNEYLPRLKQMNVAGLYTKPAPNKWSKIEILGHLADSAQNNLRRFIVAQYEEHPTIIYSQDDWVRINNYQDAGYEDLLQLWALLNRQIVEVLKNIDNKTSERICKTEVPHSIAWLATDYIRHLKHHLHQVLELEEILYP